MKMPVWMAMGNTVRMESISQYTLARKMPTEEMMKASAIQSLALEKSFPSGRRRPTARAIWSTFVRGESHPDETPATPSGSHPTILRETLKPCTARTTQFVASYSQMVKNGTKAAAIRSIANHLDRDTLTAPTSCGVRTPKFPVGSWINPYGVLEPRLFVV
jgi:hypothetical protein